MILLNLHFFLLDIYNRSIQGLYFLLTLIALSLLYSFGLFYLFSEHVILVLVFVILPDQESIISAVLMILFLTSPSLITSKFSFFESWKHICLLFICFRHE